MDSETTKKYIAFVREEAATREDLVRKKDEILVGRIALNKVSGETAEDAKSTRDEFRSILDDMIGVLLDHPETDSLKEINRSVTGCVSDRTVYITGYGALEIMCLIDTDPRDSSVTVANVSKNDLALSSPVLAQTIDWGSISFGQTDVHEGNFTQDANRLMNEIQTLEAICEAAGIEVKKHFTS